MKKKRMAVISDLHCGHIVGLTPPEWQRRTKTEMSNLPRDVVPTQRKMWGQYVAEMKALQPIDYLIVNADCIDGKGEKSGGTELITSDREEQSNMAVQCIKQAQAREQICMTYGTGYHTGVGEDWERGIAKDVGAKIGSHEWPQIYGVTFDVKHFVSGSSIPHGRGTGIAKEWVWNMLWAARGEQPKSHVIIRSHVHYCTAIGQPWDNWIALTTPALQAAGTKYGARRRSNTVDLGFIYFDIYEDGTWSWQPVRFKGSVRRASVAKWA